MKPQYALIKIKYNSPGYTKLLQYVQFCQNCQNCVEALGLVYQEGGYLVIFL